MNTSIDIMKGMGTGKIHSLQKDFVMLRFFSILLGKIKIIEVIYIKVPLQSRGRTRHIKGVGMLVISLRGVNFGFWSLLGCSGQNAIIFSREGLV